MPAEHNQALRARFADYWEICKPRVVMLMLVTVLVGMVLAPKQGPLAWTLVLWTLLGVGACASSAAALNHWLDRRIDARMKRTHQRPVATGRLSTPQVLIFALILALLGTGCLLWGVNTVTAYLTVLSLIGYAGIYTGYLKRATPQNIVIGGLAGAVPPLLGWTAVTQQIDPNGLLLVLIIFVWTPPHFWALAIYRQEEYFSVDIPMLPVVYGVAFTKSMIFYYTLLLLIVSELPWLVGMMGWFYGLTALILGAKFIKDAYQLKSDPEPKSAFNLFKYSIIYLLVLFLVMMIEHFWSQYASV